jgi:hypothetical protein
MSFATITPPLFSHDTANTPGQSFSLACTSPHGDFLICVKGRAGRVLSSCAGGFSFLAGGGFSFSRFFLFDSHKAIWFSISSTLT